MTESRIKIDNQDEESKKREEFLNLLHFVSEKYLTNQQIKLIILLDSLDQLTESNYNLKWFFSKLPNHVKIIYSCLNEFKNICKNIKMQIKKEKTNTLEIKPLTIDEAKIILWSYMNKAGRELNEKQKEAINEMIEKLFNISPLQIKIIFDIVSKFKSSYKIPDEFLKCKTSKEIIKYFFGRIEKEIIDNPILFKHCLYYLSLFEFRGISENELEDILSIDDDVLNSIFIHQHPPVRRFPMGLWYRLRYEFEDYLTTKLIDDTRVIAW